MGLFCALRVPAASDPSNCVTYARVYVVADSAKTDVNLIVGADDGIKVFLNGTPVHTNDADGGHDYLNPDEDVIDGLTLNAGENRLLVKVRQAIGAYSFSARFCDDTGDAVSGLTYSLSSGQAPVEDIIIESRSGGQNYNWYSEEGEWADISATSGAPGLTPGLGSRYGSTWPSVAGIKRATFGPDFPLAGQWRVYVTWPGAPNRRSPILYRVSHAGGVTDIDVDQTINENTWFHLGEFSFGSGFGGSVRISNDNIDESGSMYASAVKFAFVEEDPLGRFGRFRELPGRSERIRTARRVQAGTIRRNGPRCRQ